MSTTDRMRMLDRIDRALTMLDCAEAIRDGGGAVEIAGVRITQGGKRPGFSKSGDDLAEAGRNDTAVVRADDDGAGKGSTAAITGARSDAQPAKAPGEGRSEIGPQKGVQSLGDDLRDEASELCALANGKPYVVGVRPQDLIGIAQELDDYAARADALEADRSTLAEVNHEAETIILVETMRAEKAETERDKARAEVESLQRAAQVTDASWREHVERAEKAEAVVARVRALLDRPLIPSALLRDALDGVDAGGEGK